MTFFLCALIAQSIAFLIFVYRRDREWLKITNEWERLWREERSDLMNRIQAGNYAEYKAQEIRMVKAQKEEKEPPKLEQL